MGVGAEGGVVNMKKDEGTKEGSDEGLWVEKEFLWLCIGEPGCVPWDYMGIVLLTIPDSLEFGAQGRFLFALGELDKS